MIHTRVTRCSSGAPREGSIATQNTFRVVLRTVCVDRTPRAFTDDSMWDRIVPVVSGQTRAPTPVRITGTARRTLHTHWLCHHSRHPRIPRTLHPGRADAKESERVVRIPHTVRRVYRINEPIAAAERARDPQPPLHVHCLGVDQRSPRQRPRLRGG